MADTFDRAALRAELELDEGRRSRAYQDSRGIWTVGVGFNLEANALPDDVIDRLLDISIDNAVLALDVLEPRWRELDDDRQRVLVNMAFNLGALGFAKFGRMRAAVRSYLDGGGQAALALAADEMLRSRWAEQVGKRAVRLADRMRGRPAGAASPPEPAAPASVDRREE